jgi:hypothetical protein
VLLILPCHGPDVKQAAAGVLRHHLAYHSRTPAHAPSSALWHTPTPDTP